MKHEWIWMSLVFQWSPQDMYQHAFCQTITSASWRPWALLRYPMSRLKTKGLDGLQMAEITPFSSHHTKDANRGEQPKDIYNTKPMGSMFVSRCASLESSPIALPDVCHWPYPSHHRTERPPALWAAPIQHWSRGNSHFILDFNTEYDNEIWGKTKK